MTLGVDRERWSGSVGKAEMTLVLFSIPKIMADTIPGMNIIFHNSLTLYLSNDLESVQKRALKIILPHHNYENALKSTNLQRLSERRNDLTTKLFQKIVADSSHRLHGHLPPRLEHLNMELRTQHLFNIKFNTKRFRNSFITYNSLKM